MHPRLSVLQSWFLSPEPDHLEQRVQSLSARLIRNSVSAVALTVIVTMLAFEKLAQPWLAAGAAIVLLLILVQALLLRRVRAAQSDRRREMMLTEQQVALLVLAVHAYLGWLIASPGSIAFEHQLALIVVGLLGPLWLLSPLGASRLVYTVAAVPLLAGATAAMIELGSALKPVLIAGYAVALIVVFEHVIRNLGFIDQAMRARSRERSLLSQQLALFSTSQLGIAQTLNGRIGRANARFRQWFGEGAGDALLNDLAASIGMSRERLLRLIKRANDRIAGHDSRSINVLLNGATPRYFSVQVRRFDPTQASRGLLWTVSDQTSDWLSRKASERAASRDPLTGALNRRALHKRLAAMLTRDLRRQPFAVLCIDINRFGDLNHANGEGFGDQILCIVTRRIQRMLREQDVIARTGGNEFVIVLENVNAMERAAGIAEKVMETLSAPIVLTSTTCSIAAAVGVAVAPTHGRRSDEILSRARASMFAVKRTLVQVQAGKLGRRSP